MATALFEQLSASQVLTEVRACDLAERQAAARRLHLAALWVELHPAIAELPPEVKSSLTDDRLNMTLDAVAEFAAAHGVSTGAGRDLLADAVELRDRLPRCWRLVEELVLPAWKARLVAAASRDLGTEAAAFLDRHAALLAGKLTARAVHRLVLVALARYEPDRIVDPTTRRWITIAADRSGLDGAGWVDGRLEVPDALDLEAAIRTIAADLAAGGCTDTLDVRRAHAVGVLARRALGQPQLNAERRPGAGLEEAAAQGTTIDGALARELPCIPAAPAGELRGDGGAGVSAIHADADMLYATTDNGDITVTDAERSGCTAVTRPGKGFTSDGRPVTLYVHLSTDQLHHSDTGDSRGASVSRLAELGSTGQLVTVEQVRDWCGTAGAITVRPVIDLNTDRSISGYHPTDLQHEHIALRDRTCVFPHCSRPARPIPKPSTGEFTTDADHVVPYADGGDTSTDNLACLCRTHHLIKTHTHWTYQTIGTGEYLWRSPHGHHYLRTTTGTVGLNKPPATRRRRAA